MCFGVFVFLLALAVLEGLVNRRDVVPEHTYCPRCRTDLHHLTFDDACPTCELPAARRTRLECPVCRYDLSATPSVQICPECGDLNPTHRAVKETRHRVVSRLVAASFLVLAVALVGLVAVAFGIGLARTLWDIASDVIGLARAIPTSWHGFDGIFAPASALLGIVTAAGIGLPAASVLSPSRPKPVPIDRITRFVLAPWVTYVLGVWIAYFDTHLWNVRAEAWSTGAVLFGLLIALVIAGWSRKRAESGRSAAASDHATTLPPCELSSPTTTAPTPPASPPSTRPSTISSTTSSSSPP
ncbi:MAG: hypothetical protein CMJ31_13360 [Phycisphaerae bacterium]|nr:hypothetical protein [Phycisphaerae bacterium]